MPITQQARCMNAKQAKGICRVCTLPAVTGRTLCAPHRLAERNRSLAGYAVRKALGLCVARKCQNRPTPGRVRCERCRAVIAECNRLRREKRKICSA